jgi:hypothetical protein
MRSVADVDVQSLIASLRREILSREDPWKIRFAIAGQRSAFVVVIGLLSNNS